MVGASAPCSRDQGRAAGWALAGQAPPIHARSGCSPSPLPNPGLGDPISRRLTPPLDQLWQMLCAVVFLLPLKQQHWRLRPMPAVSFPAVTASLVRHQLSQQARLRADPRNILSASLYAYLLWVVAAAQPLQILGGLWEQYMGQYSPAASGSRARWRFLVAWGLTVSLPQNRTGFGVI